MDLRTTKQKEREAKDSKVAAQFKAIKKENPKAADHRIMDAMANEGRYYKSLSGIRNALIRTKTI